jgi:L-ribulose-5-phosphate 3-epimerase
MMGISHWALAGGEKRGFELAVGDARRLGLGAFEPGIGLGGAVTVETSREVCEGYRQAAAEAGIVVSSAATGLTWQVSPTHADAGVRKRGRELQRAALERAAWLGATALLVVPGAVTIPWDPSYAAVPYEEAVKWAGELVAGLLPEAEKLGVTLCVENVWNGMLYSPVEMRDFVDQFGAGRVGVYLDVGNLMGLQQWPPHWVGILGERIRRVHLKDFKIAVGGMAGFCGLGEGDVPWRETMMALRGVGYDGTVIVENSAGTEEALARECAAMERILRL